MGYRYSIIAAFVLSKSDCIQVKSRNKLSIYRESHPQCIRSGQMALDCSLACDSMYSQRAAIVRPSVCLSHGCISQKRSEVRIIKFSPVRQPHSSSFCLVSFIPKFGGVPPRAMASNKGWLGKTSRFLALCVNISKTVRSTPTRHSQACAFD